MAKRKEHMESTGRSQQTEVKMASDPGQSQPAADETKTAAEAETDQNDPADDNVEVTAEPDLGQSQPVADETKAAAEAGTDQSDPVDDDVEVTAEPDPGQSQPAEEKENTFLQEKQKYKVICRNPVSKEIGGVTFVNGVGYTDDGFTASWFRNRGYGVIGV